MLKQRAKDKQKARDNDDRLLNQGLISREELQQRNGFFSKLDIKNSKIIRRAKNGAKK